MTNQTPTLQPTFVATGPNKAKTTKSKPAKTKAVKPPTPKSKTKAPEPAPTPSAPEDPSPIRLNKFLAERIGISRRQADDLISSGRVQVNGHPAPIGTRIDKNDKVCYNGKDIPFLATYLYLAFHKPAGFVSSRRQQGAHPTLYSLLPKRYRQLKTVGRLDQDSSGLILLTNDGDFAFQMTHPQFVKEKQYYIQLDHPLAPLHQQMIADFGVNLVDGRSQFGLTHLTDAELIATFLAHSSPDLISATGMQKVSRSGKISSRPSDAHLITPASPHLISPATPASTLKPSHLAPVKAASSSAPPRPRTFWQVTMHEGRNRQIRRTFAALGYTVQRLHRVQFGPYQLATLAPGDYLEVPKSI